MVKSCRINAAGARLGKAAQGELVRSAAERKRLCSGTSDFLGIGFRGGVTSRSSLVGTKASRRSALEHLESCALLTTLYIDFGDGRPTITAGDLADPTMAAGPNYLMAGDPINPNNPIGLYTATQNLTFSPLRNIVTNRQIDFNGDGQVNAADYTDLHDSILNIVNRIFEPFNVTVKEATATNVMDVMSNFDKSGVAYVFAGGLSNGAGNGGGMGGRWRARWLATGRPKPPT